MTNTVISMCSMGHSDVWKLTSSLLPSMVKADKYIVYVPEGEVAHFQGITNPEIEVRSQDQLGTGYKSALENKLDAAENSKRYGWYLQQFFKIEAIQLENTDLVTIWDADCVPVSKIETHNAQGQIMYVNSSREFHTPYFDNIKRLLNLERVQEICFVIPSFPMKKLWISEFIQHLEHFHDIPWYEAIMKTTDFSQMSGFSETETLGTWVANKYPNDWVSRIGTWERFGQSRFGYARTMTPEKIVDIGTKNDLEIVTFENWDLRGRKRVAQRIKRLIKKA
jgi:hypothetical protein